MKRIEQRTLLGCAAVLVLLVAFGAWKFLQLRDAQNNVSSLQANISALNAQVPKYDLVVAAHNAYTAGVQRRATVLDSSVDWTLTLNSLISITPANAKVQAFSGIATAGAAAGSSPSGSSGSTPQSTTASTGSAGSSTTTSAAIGQIQLGVTGPGPSLSISEAWINAVAGSPLFANPLQGATIVNSDTSISFPFTISITPAASLDKNASIK